MLVKIDTDERSTVCRWYPVYCFSECGDCVEVDDGKVADWERVFKEFDRVQAEMEEASNPTLPQE